MTGPWGFGFDDCFDDDSFENLESSGTVLAGSEEGLDELVVLVSDSSEEAGPVDGVVSGGAFRGRPRFALCAKGALSFMTAGLHLAKECSSIIGFPDT